MLYLITQSRMFDTLSHQTFLLFVLFPICSQEEQFFINGRLPDFHQVDIPDIWIGLSGTLQLNVVNT